MRTKKVTMKDIATIAGVSQPTVSFVLNGQKNLRISDKTRKLVLDTAVSLGYARLGNYSIDDYDELEKKLGKGGENGKSNAYVFSQNTLVRRRAERAMEALAKEYEAKIAKVNKVYMEKTGSPSPLVDESDSLQKNFDEAIASLSDDRELSFGKSDLNDGHKRVALVINGALVTSDHFVCAIQAAGERARQLGIKLMMISANLAYNKSSAVAEIERIHRDDVVAEINSGLYDGVIIASPMTCDFVDDITVDIPLVYLNCIPKDQSKEVAIVPDDFSGAYDLAEHVVTKYDRPFIFAGDEWMKATSDRVRAFVSCYRHHGITIGNDHIYYSDWSFKLCFQKAVELLKLPAEERPNLFVCASDYLATAIYQAIYYAGLRIPDDIAVTGYDNQLLCTELSPELTSVVLPYEEMGELAIDVMYKFLTKPEEAEANRHTYTVPGSLMVRKSTTKD